LKCGIDQLASQLYDLIEKELGIIETIKKLRKSLERTSETVKGEKLEKTFAAFLQNKYFDDKQS
jgi:hypothetical protein